VSQWDGGPGLQSLYTWLLERLVAANVSKDAAIVVECREVVEPLRDAWHEAANQQVAAS
jgi:flagellar secretion chaperone FliS